MTPDTLELCALVRSALREGFDLRGVTKRLLVDNKAAANKKRSLTQKLNAASKKMRRSSTSTVEDTGGVGKGAGAGSSSSSAVVSDSDSDAEGAPNTETPELAVMEDRAEALLVSLVDPPPPEAAAPHVVAPEDPASE